MKEKQKEDQKMIIFYNKMKKRKPNILIERLETIENLYFQKIIIQRIKIKKIPFLSIGSPVININNQSYDSIE